MMKIHLLNKSCCSFLIDLERYVLELSIFNLKHLFFEARFNGNTYRIFLPSYKSI